MPSTPRGCAARSVASPHPQDGPPLRCEGGQGWRGLATLVLNPRTLRLLCGAAAPVARQRAASPAGEAAGTVGPRARLSACWPPTCPQEEPFWDEALAFTRDIALQRDCEVEVHSVDRAGNFQGAVRFGRVNLGGERPDWPAVHRRAARRQPCTVGADPAGLDPPLPAQLILPERASNGLQPQWHCWKLALPSCTPRLIPTRRPAGASWRRHRTRRGRRSSRWERATRQRRGAFCQASALLCRPATNGMAALA